MMAKIPGLQGSLLLPFLLLWLGAGGPASAAEIEGVRFQDRLEVRGLELELRSVGLLRYRALFKAYVAALYLDPAGATDAWRGDVPKRLEIEYFWSIRAEDFGPAAELLLARSLAPSVLAGLREPLERLHARYEDVRPGDRYALTYLPGRGTELAKNGESLVVVPGADFASAYFGIWLGADPIDRALRDQLLARHE